IAFLYGHLVQLAHILKLAGQRLPSRDNPLEEMRLLADAFGLLAIVPEIAGGHLFFEGRQFPLFSIYVKDTLPTGVVVSDSRRYFPL
ncbi:uncharacterized protein METZ01_LOCUS426786, partial [marine metagenome]